MVKNKKGIAIAIPLLDFITNPALFNYPSPFTHHIFFQSADCSNTHTGAGRALEPQAERDGAIEFQCAIDLEQMNMGAHLDRAVAGVEQREKYNGRRIGSLAPYTCKKSAPRRAFLLRSLYLQASFLTTSMTTTSPSPRNLSRMRRPVMTFFLTTASSVRGRVSASM